MRLTRGNSLALEFRRRRASSSPVLFVSAAAATAPADLSMAAGSTLVLPRPSGVAAGDLLLAFVECDVEHPALPAGWSLVVEAVNGTSFARLAVRTATPSEPSSYAFTLASADRSRTGVIVAARGAVLGASAIDETFPLAPPPMTAAGAGALLVAFASSNLATLGHGLGAVAPLAERAEHSSVGAASYTLPYGSCAATESLAAAGLVSGRAFTLTPGSGPTLACVAVVLEVAP
jgi:hypothetical protein